MTRFALSAALLCAASAGALLVPPSLAAAQQSDDDLARHFFETGRTYFDRAQYGEAAEAFGEAYRLSGRAALLVNQARALEADGDIDGAVTALERAEAELDQSSELYPSIAPRLQRLRAQQEQEARIAAERAAEAERTAGEDSTGDADDGAADDAAADEDSNGGPGTMFWVGIGTAGFGAAALITSLATGLAAHGIHGDLEASCPSGVCPPGSQSDIDRGNALATSSTVLLFVGAIAAAAGVTLILLDGGDGEDDATAATAALRIGLASVMVDGRF